MATNSHPNQVPSILATIVEGRRGHLPEIAARIAHVDRSTLPPSTRSLYDSLSARGRGGNSFIMECKSSSPSLGLIREHYRPGEIAAVYSRFASGISVLCEPDYFGGDYDHLATVASTTHLPVLCKDFIIDPVQVYAARYFGADAILLMLSVLDDDTYSSLSALADSLSLDVLTEVIDEEELERALRLGARIIGVNHRNLHDLSIDLSRSARLAALVEDSVLIVSESGIRNAETVRRLGRHSNAFLVGSQLTSQPDVDRAARELVYGVNKVCGLTSWSAAQAAKAAGALYGGLIFEETSPRHVSRETSAEIIAQEPGLDYVAVSRRTSGFDELLQAGIVAIQVHAPYQGSVEQELSLLERARTQTQGQVEIWRAISMNQDFDGAELAKALLDAGVTRLVLDAGEGGSGTSFDWSTIPAEVKDRALLAGGLGLDNLESALNQGCAGLDVNSHMEYPDQPGRKDAGKLQRAFEQIRRFSYPRSNQVEVRAEHNQVRQDLAE